MFKRYPTGILAAILLFILVVPVYPTTWSVTVVRVTTQTGYDGYPEVIQMQDAKIWIVYSRSVFGALTLFYRNSSDLGATWSDELNLTNILAPGNNQNPTVMQAQNGTIWMAWTSDRPPSSIPQPPSPDFYMNATPSSLALRPGDSDNSTISVTGINNFTDTIGLSSSSLPNVTSGLDPTLVLVPTNGTATSNLTISVDPAASLGIYTLTVTGYSPATKLFRTVDVELEITNSVESMSNAFSLSQSLYSSPDQIQDYEIFFKTSHDNGATWSGDIQLTDDAADDMRPSIVQLSNGTIMLVWQSNRWGNHDIFYMTTLDGATWSEAHQLTTDPERDTAPHVIQTDNGEVWVVWASRRTGDYEIYCKKYNGLQWSSDTRLTFSSSTTDVEPSLFQNIDDTIWIFWSSSTETGDADIFHMVSSDNGDSWSASVQFTPDNYDDTWPAITQTRDTKVWVVWSSNRADQPDGNWDIYYRTSLAGDVNGDNAIDVFDLSAVGMAYGTFEGLPGYNRDADITKDGIVDMRDLAIVTLYFGET